MKSILHIVGARPNFIKMAPVMAGLAKYNNTEQILVHTEQHYDENMSDIFFRQLDLPFPDENLGVGSGSHATQTARIMIALEELLQVKAPGLVVVYGDVNSTLAAALVCAKLHIPVGHVEAGLRCFDRSMPEEINRLLTDQIADLLFTPSEDGNENLMREGVRSDKIHFVGNVMIDTLIRILPETEERSIMTDIGVTSEKYALVTLHRPSNVDDPCTLDEIIRTLRAISEDIPIIFPVHPRTRKRLTHCGRLTAGNRLQLVEPLGYMDFLALQRYAKLVITDSGGIQEETTYLGIPCLTLRKNTERPVTVEIGTNRLVGQGLDRLQVEVRRILRGDIKKGQIPPLWDGKSGERIAGVIAEKYD